MSTRSDSRLLPITLTYFPPKHNRRKLVFLPTRIVTLQGAHKSVAGETNTFLASYIGAPTLQHGFPEGTRKFGAVVARVASRPLKCYSIPATMVRAAHASKDNAQKGQEERACMKGTVGKDRKATENTL